MGCLPRTIRIGCFLGVVLTAMLRVQAAGPAGVVPVAPTGDSLNLTVDEALNDSYYVLSTTSCVHNWVAGRFFFLPTGREIQLGLSLEGQDTRGNVASVAKWTGLRMVTSYADPYDAATYETFVKTPAGRWMSTDPFKSALEQEAGAGEVPLQTVVPEDVAPEGLSADGKAWSAWAEIETAEALPNLNIYRVSRTFAYPTATIAFRIPYTPTFLKEFCARLEATKCPGVYIDSIGASSGGRPLTVIRLEDPQPAPTGKPEVHSTILVIAREHATEHASSWAAHGALVALLRNTPEALAARKNTTWLFIPIFDPDGAAASQFDRLTDRFKDPTTADLPVEVAAYARYLAEYVNRGHTIDTVVSVHNVEANECSHIITPEMHPQQKEMTISFNNTFFQRLRGAGFQPGDPEKPWGVGMMTARLSGWTALRFGSLCLNYEVNDRYPPRRLSLLELQSLGAHFVAAWSAWSSSPAGRGWHTARRTQLHTHLQERDAYWNKTGKAPETATPAEVLLYAY